MFAYIHGLNSDGRRSQHALEQCLGKRVFNLSWESDRPFDENLAYLLMQCEKIEEENESEDAFDFLDLIGSSMGGYYASVIASIKNRSCALFNPVVYPRKTLKKFLGTNTNFATGRKYEITQSLIDTYNYEGHLQDYGIRRLVVLGKNDEILDYREAAAFYKDISRIIITEDKHQILDYSAFKNDIEDLDVPAFILD